MPMDEALNMEQSKDTLQDLDFTNGFPLDGLPEGEMVLGQSDGEDVLLVRRGTEFFAIGAHCTHYHGPLADGLLVGEEVRKSVAPCTCFSLASEPGSSTVRPRLIRSTCWRVDKMGDKVFVREKLSQPL